MQNNSSFTGFKIIRVYGLEQCILLGQFEHKLFAVGLKIWLIMVGFTPGNRNKPLCATNYCIVCMYYAVCVYCSHLK